MPVHLLHVRVHVQGNEFYLRVCVLEDDEHLVGEALADPVQAFEIQLDLPEAVQPATQTLCLQ